MTDKEYELEDRMGRERETAQDSHTKLLETLKEAMKLRSHRLEEIQHPPRNISDTHVQTWRKCPGAQPSQDFNEGSDKDI